MGNVTLNGATSGQITISPPAVAGSNTLTLPASTGTVALTNTATFNSATTLSLQTGGTTGLYIDASQNVGIGTSSPSSFGQLGVVSTTQQQIGLSGWSNSGGASSLNGEIRFGANTLYQGRIYYDAVTGSLGQLWLENTQGNGLSNINYKAVGAHIWWNNTTERMRVDSSGNLLVGATSSVNGGSVISVAAGTVSSFITAATTSTNMIVFRNGNGNVGSITTSGTSTSYNTASDYRLKENVTPMTTGLATIAALKPVNYDWISDKSQGEGFIAHELQEVVPDCVTGEKDAIDADGKPQYQGVDYSKIVVHLVAAIQELKAQNDELKARMATLEAK